MKDAQLLGVTKSEPFHSREISAGGFVLPTPLLSKPSYHIRKVCPDLIIPFQGNKPNAYPHWM